MLSARPDEEAAKTAGRLGCRLCHLADPPDQKQNVFGREMERALGRKRERDGSAFDPGGAAPGGVFAAKPQTGPRSPTRRAVPHQSARALCGRPCGTRRNWPPMKCRCPMCSACWRKIMGFRSTSIEAAFKQAGLSPELPVSLVVSEVSLQSLLKFLLAEHHLTFHTQENGLVDRTGRSQIAAKTRPQSRPPGEDGGHRSQPRGHLEKIHRPADSGGGKGRHAAVGFAAQAARQRRPARCLQPVFLGEQFAETVCGLVERQGNPLSKPVTCFPGRRAKIRSSSKAGGSNRKCSPGKVSAAGKVCKRPIAGKRGWNGRRSRLRDAAGPVSAESAV